MCGDANLRGGTYVASGHPVNIKNKYILQHRRPYNIRQLERYSKDGKASIEAIVIQCIERTAHHSM